MSDIVNHNPDILTCLANLSNDEVFTPPELANKVLDLIPEAFWSDPNVKVLDPACKSGVFLRECAKRFLKGLETKIPDLQERIDHIFQTQLYGFAITELTSQLSRRSVYCSKTANGPYSITKFKTENGHISYKRIEHTWDGKSCIYCGAPKDGYNRGKGFETYAYRFIHLDDKKFKELKDMKFDLIISNPPYQLNVGVLQENYAVPIYQKFVDQAKKLKPRYLTMIIPARWFAGGRWLDEFRAEMLEDKSIRNIVDFPDSKECFPGVDIAGGICYFLWDRNYKGNCNFVSIKNGTINEKERILNQFNIFVRNNDALTIINKVKDKSIKMLDTQISQQTPFGFITTFHGKDKPFENCLTLHSSFGNTYVSRNEVTRNPEWIDKYKVIFSAATSEHAGTPGKDGRFRVFSTMNILPPQHICSQSYFVGGVYNTEEEAQNFLAYLKTSFVRFLLLQALTSQHISRDKFIFVPLLNYNKVWKDEELFEKYNLTEAEIKTISSTIRPMDLEDSNE